MKKIAAIILAITLALIIHTHQTHISDAELFRPLFDISTSQPLHTPNTIAELQSLVQEVKNEGKKICLVGAGKSQGGQTVCPNDYRVSLQNLNHIISLDVPGKTVTIQAGMTWKELQGHIAPHKLAVKAMQSYNDFSIGGSLSVNVHGQDLSTGQIINTVESLTIITSNAQLVTASHYKNRELFDLIIGGYGLMGIIVEATLRLTDDILLERNFAIINATDLAYYFLENIKNNNNIEFYSARFSVGAFNFMKKALVVTYNKTTAQKASAPAGYETSKTIQSKSLAYMGRWRILKEGRFLVEKLYLQQREIISRNAFMSRSITELAHDSDSDRYILQEYFIPYDQLSSFICKFRRSVETDDINVLNVTARHVYQDTESVLSFAPKSDMCALVLYIHVPKTEESYAHVSHWTQRVIAEVLRCKGTYYLPYQLLATQQQFEEAYPRWKEFCHAKNMLDPQGIFTNQLYEKYKAQ